MEAFVLDPTDPTRWGQPGAGGGQLDAGAMEFLHRHVGVAEPREAPAWGDLAVPASRLSEAAVAALRSTVAPEAVDLSDEARKRYAGGLSYLDLMARRLDRLAPADAVVSPRDAGEVAAVLAVCEQHGCAVITFGGGTSVVGGLRAESIDRPTVMLRMDRMADVIDVDGESHLVTVGPGITGPELERQLAPRGLTLGHFPQSWQRASIGGYVATRSAGQSSSGYGRSDDMVESLQVTTPRGQLRLGTVAASAAGPDLRALLVGSEGAFGVITEVTLRVRTAPTWRSYTAVMFPDFHAGVDAFRSMAQQHAEATVMRLSDPEETAVTMATSGPEGRTAEVLDKYLSLRRVREPSLAIVGWEGSRSAVTARRLEGLAVLRRHGGVSLGPTVGASWARHRFDGPFLRDVLLDSGYLVETLETAAHWSRLAELKSAVTGALRASLSDGGPGPYVMAHVSHTYETSASLYFTVLARASADPLGQWRAAKAAATDAIVAAGGTVTHHHAIGRDHAPWLAQEIGSEGIAILQAVKSTLDPAGVMNPGVLGLR